ncbi:MAG: DUF1326 domain-containing protein [Thermoleophilaceae bacterium]|nr:DUF1326 domain-containing protein [Thermoleophilaceae bacterium]
MAEQWRIAGDFLDFCKCRVPCPCTFGQPPTEGDCDGIIAYRIREGSYGDVDLSGLNVVGVARFEGNIWDEDVRADLGMIIDERADERQREAIQTIFGGEAGGWPKVFADVLLGNMLGLEFAPIELEIDDDLNSWRLSVPGRAEGSTELLTGPTSRPGARLAVLNAPGSEAGPGQGAVTYGIATTDRADMFGLSWERSGRSSKHIPFEWSSEDEF